MISSRHRRFLALPVLVFLSGACNKNSSTSPSATATPTPATATVTATADPATVVVKASPEAGYAWTGAFTVTVSNTNASPITIKSITTDLQQSSGGIVITPITGTDEVFRFDVRAPGNRIDTNGNMAVPFTFHYTLPNGGREAIVSLAFAVTTDSGASGSVTATVSFQ